MLQIYISIIFLSIFILPFVIFQCQHAKHQAKLSELRSKILKIKLDMYKAHLDYLDHISKTLDDLKDVYTTNNNSK